MTNKVYIDYVTPVDAASLNDFNNHVYSSTPVSPATTLHPANLIANTPAGNIASTDVQAALNELDTKKQSALVNSAGLAAALSDETGSGLAVFNNGPTLIAPVLGTPTSGILTNCSGTAAGLTAGGNALLAGSASQTFQVAPATTGTMAPEATQYKSGIASVTATTASSAMSIILKAGAILDFRDPTLTSGIPFTRFVSADIGITVPSGATLGTVNSVKSRILILAIDSPGIVELACVNAMGGVQLDELNIINTTTISNTATSAAVFYSSTGRTGVAYKIVGYVDSTQTTAGTWAQTLTVQGIKCELINSYVLPEVQNLRIYCPGSTTTISFDSAILSNGTSFIKVPSNTITLTSNSSGVNGLDTGSLTGSDVWYYVYLISNGSNVASLLSLSLTSPTLPAGYNYFLRVGVHQTNGAPSMMHLLQTGNSVKTQNRGALASTGVAATAADTYQTLALTNYVPPIAKTISGYCAAPTTRDLQMALSVDGSVDLGRFTFSSLGTTSAMDGVGTSLPFDDYPLLVPQQLWWKSVDTVARNCLYINGYTI